VRRLVRCVDRTGQAVDTNRYFVISVNALGSAHGSSGPNTIDPRTKKLTDRLFPVISMRDMVTSQKLLVDSLGVKSLVAVVGPSMGGFQSFQWAASYPGFMKGIAASVTRRGRQTAWAGSRRSRAPGERSQLERRLVLREWRHPRHAGADPLRDPAQLWPGRGRSQGGRGAWAKIYDGHSLVTLRRGHRWLRHHPPYDRLKQTKVLYVTPRPTSCSTSRFAPGYVSDMRKTGVDVTYVELPSDKGHMASHADAAMWAPILGAFMKSL